MKTNILNRTSKAGPAALMTNEKGIILISVYIASIAMSTISLAAFGRSFVEFRAVEREMNRVQSVASAEAGLQSAVALIGASSFTGFIQTGNSVFTLQDAVGNDIGEASYVIAHPNQGDWAIVTASGNSQESTRALEGRIFLDSNFSKYLVYADTDVLYTGTDAQYGEPDNIDEDGDGIPDYPRLVPSNEDERAAIYITGDWSITGDNVKLYGDVHTEGNISGSSTSDVYGDSYSADFSTNQWGVSNSGVDGDLVISDGYEDDTDRDGDGDVDADDYPDYHDLTVTGDGDSHAVQTLTPIDHNFYAVHNNMPVYAGTSAKDRFLKFEPSGTGSGTKIVEYNNAGYGSAIAEYTLPERAIVYVNGDTYVKGEIQGRVTIVSTDDIFFTDNVSYANGDIFASAQNSAAFMAKDIIYFLPEELEVSGILYAENNSGVTRAFDAHYRYVTTSDGGYFVTDYSKEELLLHGNRVMNGRSNLSIYDKRVYGYDPNIKYFRPPGLPVIPDLRLVREIDPV